MRSTKQLSNKTYETHFERLLGNVQRLLKQKVLGTPTTTAEDFQKKLSKIALCYIDEIHKIHSKRSPLATCMLLSSLMEASLQILILSDIPRARKTSVWSHVSAKEEIYGNPLKALGVPAFTLDELITLAWQGRWLHTMNVGERDSDILVSHLKSFPIFQIDAKKEEGLKGILRKSDEARGNRGQMNSLRKFRNAIHPLNLIDNTELQGDGAFSDAMVLGCRLLLVVEELLTPAERLAEA